VLVSEASTKFLFMRNLAKVRGKVCGELLDARPARRSALPPQTTFCNTIALKADMLQRIHQRRHLARSVSAGTEGLFPELGVDQLCHQPSGRNRL
jgi:hypothetical protein